MLVIVAPYTGYNSKDISLGASKKIRFVISALSKVSSHIVLINSAHNSCEPNSFIKRKIEIAGIDLTEIILPTRKQRNQGKLSNLFQVTETLNLLSDEGTAELIWFYNAYAYEMLFAKAAFERLKVPMILEFEDWHFSRSRGLSLKPWTDFFLWKFSIKLFSHVFCINTNVKNKVEPFCKNVSLLPGVVPMSLIKIQENSPPFIRNDKSMHIGYFGGLNAEKGADIILALVDLIPDGCFLHATGSGPLVEEFKRQSVQSNGKLIFHGLLSDDELNDVISQCDIILNPHTPIAEFQDGIFPFKVIEAIASGRLLISTPISFKGFEEISGGIQFAEHSATAFAKAIVCGRQSYLDNRTSIEYASKRASELYGEQSLIDTINKFRHKTHNQAAV